MDGQKWAEMGRNGLRTFDFEVILKFFLDKSKKMEQEQQEQQE